jgi:DNA-binding transcriptional MerR regulator
MSTTTGRTYTIREAATLTGLPASTLRYYESIGVVSPVSRGETSKHRVYDEQDLDQLMWVACLSSTGMSVSDMQQYVANRDRGPAAAREQIELLEAQQRRLDIEAVQVAIRQRYVRLKVDYWRAVEADDIERADLLAAEARGLADDLKRTKRH